MTEQAGILHFSIDGEFVMNLARERYWFEDAQQHAMKILGTMQGITYDQIMAVLDGDAILTGIASQDSKITYVEQEDVKFKKKLAKHLAWKKEQIRIGVRNKARDVAKLERDAILENIRVSRAEVRTGMDNMLAFFQDKPKPKHISDPVGVGRYEVSKRQLDHYIAEYVEHHFMPVSITMIAHSRVLMELHKELRNSVGLTGFWADDDFDKALKDMCFREIEKDKRTREQRRLSRAGVRPELLTDREQP